VPFYLVIALSNNYTLAFIAGKVQSEEPQKFLRY